METNKIIVVHQAFYGIVNQSHSCIHATFKDPGLNAFLIGFTDRPGPVPAGVQMDPYYSAAAHGNYYVFTLTFPDHNAKRPGMVFTHALIVSIEGLNKLDDLDKLFDKFINNIPEIKYELEVFSLLQPIVNYSSKTFQAFIPLAVDKLLSGQSPVIFCGKTASFMQLIKSIWAGVPSSIRSKITYTIGFSGANIDESKTFIHFQPDLKQQLNNRNFVSDELDQVVEITSVHQKYLLLGDKDNGLNQFMEDLKVNLNDWSTIQISARAFEAYQSFPDLKNDALKQLIRQIATISPKPEDGELIKGKLIAELKKRLVEGSEQNLKSLRNIPLKSYPLSGEKQLEDGITLFLEKEFKKEQNFNVELISELLSLDQNPSRNWWYIGVKKSFEKIRSFTDVTQLKNVWKILITSKESLSAMNLYLQEQKSYEGLLLNTFPDDIPEKIAKVLTGKVRLKKWYLLHARLLQTYLLPKEAALKQFSIEKSDDVEDFIGTETILPKISDTDLLDISLEMKEEYYIKKYIDRTISNPSLLNNLKTDNSVWLQIWSGSIENTKKLAHGITNLSEKTEQVFTLLSVGASIPVNLLQEISESEYADISNHNERSLIWSKLPIEYKGKILKSTADSILNILEEISVETIEQELKNYMLSEECIKAFMKKNIRNIDPIINLYEWLGSSKDTLLSSYIEHFDVNISPVTSDRLGQLILVKGFSSSARGVFEKSKHNDSFKIALEKCKSIAGLGFWDRFNWGKILGEAVSRNDVYSELTNIAIKLYDKGPEDNDIWERAGGETSKLHNHKNREENWRDAINLLRNGGGGKSISSNSLITEMLEDHSNNSELKQIMKYFK